MGDGASSAGLLGVTLGNHLPDVSELVPGASSWLSSPVPAAWGLAEGWGMGDKGQWGLWGLAFPRQGSERG